MNSPGLPRVNFLTQYQNILILSYMSHLSHMTRLELQAIAEKRGELDYQELLEGVYMPDDQSDEILVSTLERLLDKPISNIRVS